MIDNSQSGVYVSGVITSYTHTITLLINMNITHIHNLITVYLHMIMISLVAIIIALRDMIIELIIELPSNLVLER